MKSRKPYPGSLTHQVQVQMKRMVLQKIKKAERATQAAAQEAQKDLHRSLRSFLEDGSMTVTPGFLLRRHVQKTFPEAVQEDAENLLKTGNTPWPPEAAEQAARFLARACTRDHGFELRRRDWLRYLQDEQTPLKREIALKIIVVTAMNQSEALDYLLACAMEPFSAHEALDLIVAFCTEDPGNYTWRDVQAMREKYLTLRPVEDCGKSRLPKQMTSWIQTRSKESHRQPTKDAAMDAMIAAMLKSSGHIRAESLSIRLEDGRLVNIRLQGFSMGRYMAFRRLAEYLELFFPYYVTDRAEVFSNTASQYEDTTFRDILHDEVDVPYFGPLAKAILYHTGLDRLEWDKPDYNKDRALYRSIKAQFSQAEQPFKTGDPFSNEMYAWQSTLVDHMYAIDRIRTGDDNLQFFRRKDALFFSYFFLSEYRKYLRWPDSHIAAGLDALKEQEPRHMDETLKTIRDRLLYLHMHPETSLVDRMNSYIYSFNLLLGALRYTNLYLPSPLDRALLMALLRDDALPALLSRKELEKQNQI